MLAKNSYTEAAVGSRQQAERIVTVAERGRDGERLQRRVLVVGFVDEVQAVVPEDRVDVGAGGGEVDLDDGDVLLRDDDGGLRGEVGPLQAGAVDAQM